MLFRKFHSIVSSRIECRSKSYPSKSTQRHTPDSAVSSSPGSTGPVSSTGSSPRNDDDIQCPICLLEMVDGESLTICDGCTNSLHQHCMAICKFQA